MAIYFNDLILEPKVNGTSLQRRYYQEREELRQLFQKFKRKGEKEATLTFTRDFNKVYNSRKTSYKPAPPIAIPYNVNIYDPEMGSVEIRYSRRPPIKNGQHLMWPRDQESLIGETLSVSEQRLDYAWFLMKASPFVNNGIIKLVDRQVEYEGTFAQIRKQKDVTNILFDDNITLETLQGIASILWPSGEVDGDSKEELATKMWNRVQEGEKNKKAHNFDALIAAYGKFAEAVSKDTSDASKLTLVTLPDGSEVEVEIVSCPKKISDEQLSEGALKYGIPTEGLSRNIIFSLIKQKKAIHES